MRQILIFVAAAAVAVVMSSAVLGSGDSSAGSPGFADRRPPRAADRAHRLRVRKAAVRDVRARLEALRLPPSATRLEKAPRGGDGELRGPFIEPQTPNLLDRSALWSVPGKPREALALIRAHPPRGSSLKIESSSRDRGVTTSWSIGFEWPPIEGIAGERVLLVTAVATATGETALRLDAQSVWIVPRPASEQVPAASRFLELSVGRPGSQARELSIVDAHTVRRIAASINELPIVQPGVTSCPAEFLHPVIVRLTFRAARGARALAEAEQKMPAGTCSPMRLSIRGTREPPLSDGWRVMRRLRPLLRKARLEAGRADV